MRLSVAFISIVSYMFVGCATQPSSHHELVGNYKAIFEFGVESVTLNADTTYSQEFQYKNGKSLSNSGIWEYPVRCFNEKCVVLLDAMKFDDSHGGPASDIRRYDWFVVPYRRFGKTWMEFNDDLGIKFEKRS